MKRMTENPIGYYTVTKDDIKNITVKGEGLFKYTPSQEFIEVLQDFEAILRVDWIKIAENIYHIIGASFSVLYPINKIPLTDNGNIAYSYSAGSVDTKQINPVFYELKGEYFINWNSLNS